MATRKPIYINGVNGVSAGGTATVTVPTNIRYHSLNILTTDNGAPSFAKVNEIRLTVDGTLMQRWTPDELDKLYKLNLNTTIAGNLFIPFSEITRATVLGEEISAWQTYGVGKFEIAVDFDSTATNPTMRVLATQDSVQLTETVGGQVRTAQRPLQVLPFSYTPGAGWFDITTIPNDSPIQAIYIQTTTTPTAGDILAYEVYRGQEKVAEGTYLENIAALAPYGYDGTAFILPIIFDREHQNTNALDCRQLDANGNVVGQPLPLTIRVNMNAAKGIKCLVSRVRQGFN